MLAVFIEESDDDAAARIVVANRVSIRFCEDLVNHDRVCLRRKRPLFGFEMQIDPGFESLRT